MNFNLSHCDCDFVLIWEKCTKAKCTFCFCNDPTHVSPDEENYEIVAVETRHLYFKVFFFSFFHVTLTDCRIKNKNFIQCNEVRDNRRLVHGFV